MFRRHVGLLLGTAALVLAFAAVSYAANDGAVRLANVPADIVLLADGELPPGTYVPEATALDVARREHAFIPNSAAIAAYLLQATEPGTINSRDPIFKRPVWVVRYSGFSLRGPLPDVEDGKPIEPRPYDTAYVFVDALTGVWLGTRLENVEVGLEPKS